MFVDSVNNFFIHGRCKVTGCGGGFTTKQCLQFHYKRTHAIKEEDMPKIERDIPYTFSAYSGGSLRPLAGAAEEKGKEKRAGGKEEGDDDDKRGEKCGFKDVYTFDEEEDELNDTKEPVSSIPRHKSAPEASRRSAASPLSPSGPSPSKAESGETLHGQSGGSEAGLLVMAALTAAENDIMGDKGDAPDRSSKEEGTRGGEECAEKSGENKKHCGGERDGTQASSRATPCTPSQASPASPSHLNHSARSLLSKRPRTPQRDILKKDDCGAGEPVNDSPRPQPQMAAAPGSALSVKGPPPPSLPPPPPPPNPNPYLSSFPSEPSPLYPTALDIAATNYHAPGPYHHHQHPQHLGLRPRGGYPQYPHHQVAGASVAADFQHPDHPPPSINEPPLQSGLGGDFASPSHPHYQHHQIDPYPPPPPPFPPKDSAVAAAAVAQFGYAAAASYHHPGAPIGYPQLPYPGPPLPSPSSSGAGAPPGSIRVPPPTSNAGPHTSPGTSGNTYNHYYF